MAERVTQGGALRLPRLFHVEHRTDSGRIAHLRCSTWNIRTPGQAGLPLRIENGDDGTGPRRKGPFFGPDQSPDRIVTQGPGFLRRNEEQRPPFRFENGSAPSLEEIPPAHRAQGQVAAGEQIGQILPPGDPAGLDPRTLKTELAKNRPEKSRFALRSLDQNQIEAASEHSKRHGGEAVPRSEIDKAAAIGSRKCRRRIDSSSFRPVRLIFRPHSRNSR